VERTHYVRIWADLAGESHFEDVSLDISVSPAEPGVAELWISDQVDVDRAHFVMVQAIDQVPDWHCAPRRQFVVFLNGWVRITVSDGESRTLPAGSVVLAEDLTGSGHVTEHEPGERRVLLLPLVATAE
jgi:quercetin dioxygenase-like cupin family protein